MIVSLQQNRVVERRNRILLEIARCLIAGRNLFQKLWPEAMSTAAYLHNILPSKATPHSTLEELYLVPNRMSFIFVSLALLLLYMSLWFNATNSLLIVASTTSM